MPSSKTKPKRRLATDPATLHRHVRTSALFMLVLLVGMIGGVVLGRETGSPKSSGGSFADLDAVADVLLGNYFYRPKNDAERTTFQEQLQQNAISGMLSGLNDEYTRYLLPADAHIAADQLDGEYGGVGVTLAVADGVMGIARVEPYSPASEGGLEAGDIIERIDNKPVAALTDYASGSDITGSVGSTVVLSVRKHGDASASEITLTREAIIDHQVTWEMIPNTTYLHVSIDIFGDRTVQELDEALAGASLEHATGLILDLRGNGGGWVKTAQQVLGRFLDPAVGPALYEDTTPGAGGETAIPIEASKAAPTTLPMIVLVDGQTASAAEIVAGSLRDYNRALVVGDQTYGKGSVQTVFDLADGSSLRVTVAEWLTPSKGRIQDEGIRPDLDVATVISSTGGDAYIGAAVSFLDSGVATPVQLATSRQTTPDALATPAS